MKKDAVNLIAIDCGNSSVRIVLGRYDGHTCSATLIDQVAHREIFVNGVWHWDILFIFERIKEGLRKAHGLAGKIDSVGISTWGIDHGLFDENGLLLANPFCYRNPFGQTGLSGLSESDRRFMFDATGIQCDKINSVYQMLGYRDVFPSYWKCAKSILLIPDLLNFFLTGEKNTDSSITSTTQLYDVKNDCYADKVFEKFHLDRLLFPEVIPHGRPRGQLREDIAEELGVNRFTVVSVPSHDTAAAVAAIPTTSPNEHPLFISSGTWSLIGVELPKPIVNDHVYASGLANEGGILGTITLLKNSAGLFIAQRLKKECDVIYGVRSWDEIVAEIDGLDGESAIIDPNAEEFFNPLSMRDAITAYIRRTGQKEPKKNADFFRVVYESLARSYRDVIVDLENVCGKRHDVLNIIGGGSKNRLLNQITARVTGKKVVAGPFEATSLGTLGSLLLHEGSASSLADIRRIMAASIESTVFTA